MYKCRWDVLPPLASCMSRALNHRKSVYRDGGHSLGHITPPEVNVLGRWSQSGALKVHWDGVGH